MPAGLQAKDLIGTDSNVDKSSTSKKTGKSPVRASKGKKKDLGVV